MTEYIVVVVCGSELDEPDITRWTHRAAAQAHAEEAAHDLSQRADDVWVTILGPDGLRVDLEAGAEHPHPCTVCGGDEQS